MTIYLLQVYRLKEGMTKLIEDYNLYSDYPFSLNIERKDGNGLGEVVLLEEQRKLLIEEKTLSSHHAILTFYADGTIFYRDQGSTNGSYILPSNYKEIYINNPQRVTDIFGKNLCVLLGSSIIISACHAPSKTDTEQIE